MTTFNAPQITPKRVLVLTTLKENVVEARRAKIVEILKRIWTGVEEYHGHTMEVQIGNVVMVSESLNVLWKYPLSLQKSNFDAFVDDFFNLSDGFDDSREAAICREPAEWEKLKLGLQWFDTNELGMSVTCPHGNVMKWPDALLDCCDGWMDIHMNESGETTSPVDHIVFGNTPGHGLTIGEYRISVQMLTQRNSAPSKYRMLIDRGGYTLFSAEGEIDGENSIQHVESLFIDKPFFGLPEKFASVGVKVANFSFLLTDEKFIEEQNALLGSFGFGPNLAVMPIDEELPLRGLMEKVKGSGQVVHPDLLVEFIRFYTLSTTGIAFDPWIRGNWPDPHWDDPQYIPPPHPLSE